MIYIYDILLNFCDSDFIYDFYEWDKNDDINNIKRIKLMHVTKNIYDILLKYDVVVDKEFLVKIFKTCEVYDRKKVKVLDYCTLFSDGERVMAIEFNKNGKSMYKSKLLIDEEEEIAVLANKLEISDIKINEKKLALESRFYTREEGMIRLFLQKEINDAYKNKKYCKLNYLYQEYFEKSIKSYKKMKDELILSINSYIDDKHRTLYNLLKLTKKNKQI